MRAVFATIDSKITIDGTQLEDDLGKEILSRLTIHNSSKEIALKEFLWNAHNLPDYINLWEYDHPYMILPRGFVFELERFLKQNDIEVEWDDRMVVNEVDWSDTIIPLRDYQEVALDKLLEYCNGTLSAPTGAGKSRMMLALANQLKQKTIIFVEKTDLLKQWVKAAEEFDLDVGVIGESSWDDSHLVTIALRQAVWERSKFPDLLEEWHSKFGTVIVDECHHVASDTMWTLLQQFPAYYRFGCSATPDSDQGRWDQVKALIGPIVHLTTPEEAEEALVTPSIVVVETEFDYDYQPTQKILNYTTGKYQIIRNNYNSMMKNLEENKERNELIAGNIIREAKAGHKCLVISKRINHLIEINDCIPSGLGIDILTLIGDNSKEYEIIKEEVENCDKGIILLSTLAEEGTDIPCLDRIFLTYPGRKLRGFEQCIGRITRKALGKNDAVAYDFKDVKVSILRSQFRDRLQRIYHKREYKVEYR